MAKLPEKTRAAVILRFEFGFSFPEVAEAMNMTSANSARMMVSRALLKLSDVMEKDSDQDQSHDNHLRLTNQIADGKAID